MAAEGSKKEGGEVTLDANFDNDQKDRKEEGDYDFLQDDSFWSTGEFMDIKNVTIKYFYDDKRMSYYVAIRKINKMAKELGVQPNSIMLIPARDVAPLKKAFELYLDDIAATRYDATPRCLKGQGGKLKDFTKDEFWACAINVGNLAVRPFYHESQGYVLKILQRREFRGDFQNWIGRTISLSLPVVQEVMDVFTTFEKKMGEEDEKRIYCLTLTKRSNFDALSCGGDVGVDIAEVFEDE